MLLFHHVVSNQFPLNNAQSILHLQTTAQDIRHQKISRRDPCLSQKNDSLRTLCQQHKKTEITLPVERQNGICLQFHVPKYFNVEEGQQHLMLLLVLVNFIFCFFKLSTFINSFCIYLKACNYPVPFQLNRLKF